MRVNELAHRSAGSLEGGIHSHAPPSVPTAPPCACASGASCCGSADATPPSRHVQIATQPCDRHERSHVTRWAPRAATRRTAVSARSGRNLMSICAWSPTALGYLA
eukprot:6179669-Pleurochrysis_carterae.AAC.4